MKKENDEQEIELRSEEFQEVLGNVSHWIVRWGITSVAIVAIIVLGGSAIFKYPDTITATVKLTGVCPAEVIVAKSTGKIQHVYVSDNQQVKENTYLALIDNAAKMEDVLYVRNFLKSQSPWEVDSVALPTKELALGDFQTLYSSYYSALAEYIQFKNLDYYKTKVKLMKKRVVRNEKYYKNMNVQEALAKKQLLIGQKQYQRDSSLHARGMISDLDLENAYNQYLQTQLSYENMANSMENQQIQLAQLHESLYDTEYQYIEKKNKVELQLKSLTMQLLTEIQNWEMAYVLKSSINGKVTFTNYWTENQNIKAGEIAFNIVPNKSAKLFGKALLPSDRSGKVKIGQKVIIRFGNFPDKEFGVIQGEVSNISLASIEVNNTNNYIVEISLPKGLKTTYGKQLPFIPEMEGQADIITDDLSVLERILLPIKKVLKESI